MPGKLAMCSHGIVNHSCAITTAFGSVTAGNPWLLRYYCCSYYHASLYVKSTTSRCKSRALVIRYTSTYCCEIFLHLLQTVVHKNQFCVFFPFRKLSSIGFHLTDFSSGFSCEAGSVVLELNH